MCRFALFALFSLIMGASCAPPLPPAVVSFFTTQNNKDCQGWVALFAEKFEVQDPLGSAPVTSHEELLKGCQGTNGLFKEISLEPVKEQAYAPPGSGSMYMYMAFSRPHTYIYIYTYTYTYMYTYTTRVCP